MKKALLLKLFDAFAIQRWNDRIRPVDLFEMDKNAHKMAIAYCLGRYEEDDGKVVNWGEIIRGGIYELLRRVVLSDIKSPVYRKIKDKHEEVFCKLNSWVCDQLSPCIDREDIRNELCAYLKDEEIDDLSQDILAAAHIYASYWEFMLIKHANPESAHLMEVDRLMQNDMEKYLHLKGMRKIVSKHKITNFIDLFGQLRFQIRWGHTPRIPATSVLGHTMMVGSISYFLTRELGGCDRRLRNNFFGGLFHDLPEAVTRDIISPVKAAVDDFPDVISKIEEEMVRKEVYPHVEEDWVKEFEYFTEDEFSSKIVIDDELKKVTSEEITLQYNEDYYNPLDGEITKISDHLAAFVEAYKASESGIKTPQIEEGRHRLMNMYKGKNISGINIGALYADF